MAAGAPAGLASRPRGLLLASASHSGRGLVPPRAPGRGQLCPLLFLLLLLLSSCSAAAAAAEAAAASA